MALGFTVYKVGKDFIWCCYNDVQSSQKRLLRRSLEFFENMRLIFIENVSNAVLLWISSHINIRHISYKTQQEYIYMHLQKS